MTGFVKAQRQRVFLKVAVTGPSGSGKTYSSLRLGFGLAGKDGKVAFVDTENGSGSLYADLGSYDVMQITVPYTAQKYIAAIKDAVAAGYQVVIIDSLSHAWAGEGGILDQKTARDARGGNSFSNWAEASKPHEMLKNAVLHEPIHVIATMRSKQDYVMEQGQGGKQTPRKVGLAPIQREGMEYEFTTVFDVDMTHTAATSKDRTGLFTDEIGQMTEGHGERLRKWLSGGVEPQAVRPAAPASPAPTAAPHSETSEYEALRKTRKADLTKALKAKTQEQITGWLDRFGAQWGERSIAALNADQLGEALLAVTGDNWPYEDAYQASQPDTPKRAAPKQSAPAAPPIAQTAPKPEAGEDDPFADDLDLAAASGPAEAAKLEAA